MGGWSETTGTIPEPVRAIGPYDQDAVLGEPCNEAWPAAALQDLSSITVATTATELENIGRLRHALYVKRDGKPYGHVDAMRGVFLEPVDRVSLNLQALAGPRLLASVRLTRAADALSDPHLRLVIDAIDPPDLARSVIASRLAVRPEKEARALIETVFRDAYRRCFASGARSCFLATRESLIGLFLKAGFRPFGRSYLDPVAGRLQPMVFDAGDRTVLDVRRPISKSSAQQRDPSAKAKK